MPALSLSSDGSCITSMWTYALQQMQSFSKILLVRKGFPFRSGVSDKKKYRLVSSSIFIFVVQSLLEALQTILGVAEYRELRKFRTCRYRTFSRDFSFQAHKKFIFELLSQKIYKNALDFFVLGGFYSKQYLLNTS